MSIKDNVEGALPIKLDKISKRLWPRKIYIRMKTYHPVLGSIFVAFWTIFWFLMAIVVNVLFLIFIIALIVLFIIAIAEGSSFDPVFTRRSKKEKDR